MAFSRFHLGMIDQKKLDVIFNSPTLEFQVTQIREFDIYVVTATNGGVLAGGWSEFYTRKQILEMSINGLPAIFYLESK